MGEKWDGIHRDRDGRRVMVGDEVVWASSKREPVVGVIVAPRPRNRVRVHWVGDSKPRSVRCDYLVAASARVLAEGTVGK